VEAPDALRAAGMSFAECDYAVRQLVSRYAIAVDAQRWDMFDELFTESVVADYTTKQWTLIEAWKADFAAFHAQFSATQHCVGSMTWHWADGFIFAFSYVVARLIRRGAAETTRRRARDTTTGLCSPGRPADCEPRVPDDVDRRERCPAQRRQGDGDADAVRLVAGSVEKLGFDHLATYEHVLGVDHADRSPPLSRAVASGSASAPGGTGSSTPLSANRRLDVTDYLPALLLRCHLILPVKAIAEHRGASPPC
jgi:hypothetical protein